MNILFLSELFHPHGGGAELATYLYAKLLSQAGLDVKVITNRFEGESEGNKSENLTVYRLPLFKKIENAKYSILSRTDVLCSNLMKRLVKWADLVYVPRFWYTAILLAKANKKPVITHIHDYLPICPLTNLYNMSEKAVCKCNKIVCSPSCIYLYERMGQRRLDKVLYSVLLNSTFKWFFNKIVGMSDAIVCVSEAQKKLLTKNFADLHSKIHVIYNPLPNAPLVDVNGDDFGYFGGSSYMKGFHVLAKAVAHINRADYDPPRIHATKFSNLSEKSKETLRRLGIYAHGKLSGDEYKKLYSQIRTIIVPSVWNEPLPYVVTEAMISRRLVVASNVGGIIEQVDGCKGTFLFRAGDYEQLAERILYVKSLSRETMLDLGIKNREWVLKKFDNEKIVANFTSLLSNLRN